MQKHFIRNLFLLLTLNLLIKPFWILGIDRSIQNRVGDADFGLFLSLTSFSFLFYILLDLGITNFNNRNIARNRRHLQIHFAGIMGVKILLGLVYMALLMLFGLFIGYDKRQLNLLFWVGLNATLLSMIMYLRSNISGLLLFKADSLLSVLDRSLMIVFCSLLLWTPLFGKNLTVADYVYAQTIAYALTFFIALVLVMRHAGKLAPTFDFRFMNLILRRSAPFALLVFLMSVYNRLEPVLIERLLPGETGLTQTGIYAKAFRLFDAGNNISMLFAVLLLPMFARMLKQNESVSSLTRLSFGLIFGISAIAAACGIAYAEPIMKLLYGLRPDENLFLFENRINQSAAIFSLLMLAYVCVSSTYVFGTLLTANGSLKLLNFIAASGVALSIVLNVWLIPKYQAIGAAFACVTVQFVMAILQFVTARKVTGFRFEKTYFAKLMFFLILLIASTLGLRQLEVNWMLTMALTVLAGILSINLSGLVPAKEISAHLLPKQTEAQNG